MAVNIYCANGFISVQSFCNGRGRRVVQGSSYYVQYSTRKRAVDIQLRRSSEHASCAGNAQAHIIGGLDIGGMSAGTLLPRTISGVGRNRDL